MAMKRVAAKSSTTATREWRTGKDCEFSLQLKVRNERTQKEYFLPSGSYGWDLNNVRETNAMGMGALECILMAEEYQAMQAGESKFIGELSFKSAVSSSAQVKVYAYLKRNFVNTPEVENPDEAVWG